jgi:hypothetical protein
MAGTDCPNPTNHSWRYRTKNNHGKALDTIFVGLYRILTEFLEITHKIAIRGLGKKYL